MAAATNTNDGNTPHKWVIPTNTKLAAVLNELQEWSDSSLKRWNETQVIRETLLQTRAVSEERVSREFFPNFEVTSLVLKDCMTALHEAFRDPLPATSDTTSLAYYEDIIERLRAVLNRFEAHKAEFDRLIKTNGPKTQEVSDNWNALVRESPDLVKTLDPSGCLYSTYVCQAHHGCWFTKFRNLLSKEVAKQLPDDVPGVQELREELASMT